MKLPLSRAAFLSSMVACVLPLAAEDDSTTAVPNAHDDVVVASAEQKQPSDVVRAATPDDVSGDSQIDDRVGLPAGADLDDGGLMIPNNDGGENDGDASRPAAEVLHDDSLSSVPPLPVELMDLTGAAAPVDGRGVRESSASVSEEESVAAAVAPDADEASAGDAAGGESSQDHLVEEMEPIVVEEVEPLQEAINKLHSGDLGQEEYDIVSDGSQGCDDTDSANDRNLTPVNGSRGQNADQGRSEGSTTDGGKPEEEEQQEKECDSSTARPLYVADSASGVSDEKNGNNSTARSDSVDKARDPQKGSNGAEGDNESAVFADEAIESEGDNRDGTEDPEMLCEDSQGEGSEAEPVAKDGQTRDLTEISIGSDSGQDESGKMNEADHTINGSSTFDKPNDHVGQEHDSTSGKEGDIKQDGEAKVLADDEDDGPTERLIVDYANKNSGAIILEKSPSMKGTSNLLKSDNDQYAIAPCEDRKFVVIGLSEDILVKQIKLSNYERYSSHTREFQVMGSQTNTGSDWADLGTFTAQPGNGEQVFDLEEPAWARYLKFRFITHYGAEHYCTVTQIKVHGSTMTQGFHEQWVGEQDSEDEGGDVVQEAVTVADKVDNSLSEEDAANKSTDTLLVASGTSDESDVSGEGKLESAAADDDSDQSGGEETPSDTVPSEDPELEGGGEQKDSNMAMEGLAKDGPDDEEMQTHDISATQIQEVEQVAVKPNSEARENDGDEDLTNKSGADKNTPEPVDESESFASDAGLLHIPLRHGEFGWPGAPSWNMKQIGPVEISPSGALYCANDNIANMGNDGDALSCASIKTSSSFKTSSDIHQQAQPEDAAVKVSASGVDISAAVKAVVTDASDAIMAHTEKASAGVSVAMKEIHKMISTKMSAANASTSPTSPENSENSNGTSSATDLPDQGVSLTGAGESRNVQDETASETRRAESEMKDVDAAEAASGDFRSKVEEARKQVSTAAADSEKQVSEPKTLEETDANSGTQPGEKKQESNTSAGMQQREMAEKEATTRGASQAHTLSAADADILNAILHRFPRAACLNALSDPQGFRAAKVTAGRVGQNKEGGSGTNKAGGGPGNMQPIFKTLSDQIKSLQYEQLAYDQYMKALNSCYQQIILDMARELQLVESNQAERLLLLEDAVRVIRAEKVEYPFVSHALSSLSLVRSGLYSACLFLLAVAQHERTTELAKSIGSKIAGLEGNLLHIVSGGIFVLFVLLTRRFRVRVRPGQTTQEAEVKQPPGKTKCCNYEAQRKAATAEKVPSSVL